MMYGGQLSAIRRQCTGPESVYVELPCSKFFRMWCSGRRVVSLLKTFPDHKEDGCVILE